MFPTPINNNKQTNNTTNNLFTCNYFYAAPSLFDSLPPEENSSLRKREGEDVETLSDLSTKRPKLGTVEPPNKGHTLQKVKNVKQQ